MHIPDHMMILLKSGGRGKPPDLNSCTPALDVPLSLIQGMLQLPLLILQ